MSIFHFLFGRDGGLTHKELRDMTYRHKFSDYFPYIAYDPGTKTYLLADNTIGWLWECSSACYAGEKMITILSGLFRLGFPDGSVLQFILYTDTHIRHFVDSFKSNMQRESPLVQKAKDAISEFYLNGIPGLENILPKNFRLFVGLKIPVASKEIDTVNLYDDTQEILTGALLYSSPLLPEDLLDFLRRFFNDDPPENCKVYMDDVPISKQIIFSQTIINVEDSYMRVGNKYLKCLTPVVFPPKVDPLQTNQVFGGIHGMISDVEQYKTPFLYSLNIVFEESLKSKLRHKCDLVLMQRSAGSFAMNIARRQDEYRWAVDEIERGTRFFRIIPTLLVWSEDKNTVVESSVRAKRIWESNGYIMQEEKTMLPIFLIMSLPFGLYNIKSNLSNIDRDFIAHTDAIAPLLPVQSDFSGTGEPMLLFLGRKGQVCGVDIFSSKAKSHNVLVAATTGVGKSFLVNYLTSTYYSANAMVRIIDIGGSYKKMTEVFGAKYLDFTPDSNICINPFSNIKEEELESEISNIAAVIFQMIYSATNKPPTENPESVMTLVKAAVSWAVRTHRDNADINTVYKYLNSFPKYASEYDFDCPEKEKCAEKFSVLAQEIAFNLFEFTSNGLHGKWFNGKSNFDISKDEFVVLELEHIKSQQDLFRVITLQVINAVTKDLYLSDRSKKRLIIFDEAWQFLKEDAAMKQVIEEGYRRARKYGGSFTIVVQSILDLKSFGSVGDVIMGNSAFKFYLESPDFEKAAAEKQIYYDKFVMDLLKTVKTNKPKYSEIFMDTPFGFGVARLIVDSWSYYMYTSDVKEISEISSYVAGGMSYDEAISEMVKNYRS